MTIDDAIREAFVEETAPLAADVRARLLHLERDVAALTRTWRAVLGALHTIKGNCGMVGLDDAQALAHALEQRVREVRTWAPEAQAGAIDHLLGAADALGGAVAADPDAEARMRDAGARLDGLDPEAPVAEPRAEAAEPSIALDELVRPVSHVRVSADSLDRLLEATADLATWHERLRRALPASTVRRAGPHEALLDGADRRLADLRAAVLALRLVPLSTLGLRFERLVRDLARVTGKPAVLDARRLEVSVDKQVVDQLAEPLLHIIRNAVDHGLEPARERIRAGKPEVGTVRIEARAHGGVLTLRVGDDGRGIDRVRLAAAAARRGVDTAGWTPEQVLDLVFAPDLSTAERVTELSGRGVGLDQARRALGRIGGSIDVVSEPGAGTEFRIRVPLVIAVQRALLVGCGPALLAIPFTSVIEAIRVAAADVDDAGVPWRNERLPARHLGEELGLGPRAPGATATWVIVDAAAGPVALGVDRLAGHQDLMIQDLDPIFGRPRAITGAAALADGRIVTVVDPLGLENAA